MMLRAIAAIEIINVIKIMRLKVYENLSVIIKFQ